MALLRDAMASRAGMGVKMPSISAGRDVDCIRGFMMGWFFQVELIN